MPKYSGSKGHPPESSSSTSAQPFAASRGRASLTSSAASGSARARIQSASPAASPAEQVQTKAELAAAVMVRLLRQHAALGGEVGSCETEFEGKWQFGNQVLNIVGRGTDLTIGKLECHFKPLTSKTCELFLLDSKGGALMHVVPGRISADLQSIQWNNGKTWHRVRQGEQDDMLQQHNQRLAEENRRLREENQHLLQTRGRDTDS